MTKIVLKLKISPEEAHQGAGASLTNHHWCHPTRMLKLDEPPAGDQGIRNHFQL